MILVKIYFLGIDVLMFKCKGAKQRQSLCTLRTPGLEKGTRLYVVQFGVLPVPAN